MSSFGGPRLILTVPGGSSRPNKTSSVKKSKFSKLSLMPFCQITADYRDPQTEDDQYVSMRGTLADTEEVLCDADFSKVEGEKICTLTSNVNIGEFRCIRWRTGGDDGLHMDEVDFMDYSENFLCPNC